MLALIPYELRLNEPWALTNLAEVCAAVLADLGHHARAIQMIAAADEMRERMGTPRTPMSSREDADLRAKTHATMTDQRWRDLYQTGRVSTLEDLLRTELAAGTD